jgi:hypothetical protein
MTETNMTLADHIAALNSKTQAWIDEAPGRGACLYISDIAHWNSIGIHTVEDFERYELENDIWDTYKEVFGVRPRGLGLKDMSIDELRLFLSNLNAQQQITH